jgi:hypothetical protein
MLILGHVGTTMGVCRAVKMCPRPIPVRKILILAGAALLPDVLDRTVMLFVPDYTTHGVFHSVFLYALALPAAYLLLRAAFSLVLVMAFNVLCDLVSTDLRAFVYPLYGWTGQWQGTPVLSPIDSFLMHYPHSIGIMLPTHHYVIFEILGAVLFWLAVRYHS